MYARFLQSLTEVNRPIIDKTNVTMNEKMMICLIKSGASINLTLHLHDVIAVNSKLLHHQFQY